MNVLDANICGLVDMPIFTFTTNFKFHIEIFIICTCETSLEVGVLGFILAVQDEGVWILHLFGYLILIFFDGDRRGC